MQATKPQCPEAEFGPLHLRITEQGSPSDEMHGNVRKLRARFALAVNGEEIVSNAPFTYGSTDAPAELARAADALQSVLADLQSIEPHIGVGSGRLDEWADWADNLGYFAGDSTAADIRQSIEDYQSIRAWRDLITERLSDFGDEDADEQLATILDVARECEQDEPELNGELLRDAGSVGIDKANAARDTFNGKRWEDAYGNVYSAAEILAERLA